jgi:hypothetical protein
MRSDPRRAGSFTTSDARPDLDDTEAPDHHSGDTGAATTDIRPHPTERMTQLSDQPAGTHNPDIG